MANNFGDKSIVKESCIIECIDKFDLKNGQISYFFFFKCDKIFLVTRDF